jgi:hypothetical protein
MAKLDRYLCTLSWNNYFNNNIVISLPRFLSDHTPIILGSSILHLTSSVYFKFEKYWITQEGFYDFIIRWWYEYCIIDGEFGNGWRLKLQHMRKK